MEWKGALWRFFFCYWRHDLPSTLSPSLLLLHSGRLMLQMSHVFVVVASDSYVFPFFLKKICSLHSHVAIQGRNLFIHHGRKKIYFTSARSHIKHWWQSFSTSHKQIASFSFFSDLQGLHWRSTDVCFLNQKAVCDRITVTSWFEDTLTNEQHRNYTVADEKCTCCPPATVTRINHR